MLGPDAPSYGIEEGAEVGHRDCVATKGGHSPGEDASFSRGLGQVSSWALPCLEA